ncbi:hypothetical protein [Streptomyces sp. SID11385]|uniref:hypothetical protein n=1 Tax=Streptomyces sp. SID11385 TaxID=2706031 RepID=UPI0013C8063A|nr:hypothetical protein [Streptomyces sp. SID11385]NEA37698.1 hypothetical protein [Streptomyces sp. SID11385]
MNDGVSSDRALFADLLTDAAQEVSRVFTADYPTTASRSYLYPALGPLSAGPRVVDDLTKRLEDFLAESLPSTPLGLFTLASYASALGWLAESLAELTTAVEGICALVGLPTSSNPAPTSVPSPDLPGLDELKDAGEPELFLDALQAAADDADLTPPVYLHALTASLLAATTMSNDCTEIMDGLIDDAALLLSNSTDHVWSGDGSEGLPTLVRSLLARIEEAR